MSSHLRLFNNQGEKIMQRTLNRESSKENITASADFSLQRIAGDGIVNDSFDYTMKTSDFFKTTN